MKPFPPHVPRYPARAAALRPVKAAILVTSGLLALALTIAALYLAKSALGINLMPGPSPLHAALYHFVR